MKKEERKKLRKLLKKKEILEKNNNISDIEQIENIIVNDFTNREIESDITILKEVSYKFIPQNEKYYNITFEDKETQEKHQKLWNEILEKGFFIKNEFAIDFIVSTYKYNDKYYQLWYNNDYGYNDHIKEYTR